MDKPSSDIDASNSPHPSAGSEDEDYNPTSEMMVGADFDDERTLEEEEGLSPADEDSNELDSLAKEGDMPLEELLRSYGYQPIGDEASQSSSSEEILSNHDLTLDREVIARDLLGEITGGSPDQDSDTSDYILHPYKSVRVGEDHQASIPALEPYESDALPYDNPDFLMWSPYATDFSEKETEDYLNEIQTLASASSSVKSGGQSQQIPSTPPSSSISNWLPSHKAALPAATYVKDNEAALLLLQQCGNDKSEALRRWKLQSASGGVASPLNTDWSETECEAFEQGLRQFGKNFSQIQRHQVKTRSVGELVYFYYQWKKTLRHDAYMAGNRLEKKRYFLNPNITDLMERYITEGQFLFDSVSTSSSSTLPGYSNHHHHHHHYHHFHASTTTSVMTSFCSSNGEAATDGPSSDVTTTASHPSSYPRATSPVSSIFSLIHSDSRRRTPPIPTSPSYNSHHHSHSHHSTSSFFSPIQAPSTAQESAHHVQVRVSPVPGAPSSSNTSADITPSPSTSTCGGGVTPHSSAPRPMSESLAQ